MDKRRLHHFWTRFRRINPWLFLAVGVASLIIFSFAYRQNNLISIKLAQQLTEVDKANGDVSAALNKLRVHIYGHMNAGLRSENGVQQPIQLKYTYDRLVAAEKSKTDATNTKIYNDAQVYCEKFGAQTFSGGGRVTCIQSYVDSHGLKSAPIPDELYKFDFVSPRWSPDLAGWSLVVAALCFVSFALLLISERLIRRQLR